MRSRSNIPSVLNTPGRGSSSALPVGVALDVLRGRLDPSCEGEREERLSVFGVPGPCALIHDESA